MSELPTTLEELRDEHVDNDIEFNGCWTGDCPHNDVLVCQSRAMKNSWDACYTEMKKWCPCGGIILADTEDWPIRMCADCYEFFEKREAKLVEALQTYASERLPSERDTEWVCYCGGGITSRLARITLRKLGYGSPNGVKKQPK